MWGGSAAEILGVSYRVNLRVILESISRPAHKAYEAF
jgi:hypothetical protein